MPDQVFLRLYGENSGGQRVVYEASLEGSTIRTRICNRVTGQAEPAADAQRFFHRITLFDHATQTPLTTFDLLKDREPVKLEGGVLRLSLRVRCYLMRPGGEDLVLFTGSIGVASAGGPPRPVFHGLTANLGSFYDPPRDSFEEVPITELAGQTLSFNPRSPFTNVFARVVGISGQQHTPAPLLHITFEPQGTGGSGRCLLTFSQSIRIRGSSTSLAFRSRFVEVPGDSTWTFLQKAPVGEGDDPTQEREELANRWSVRIDSGEGAKTHLLRTWNEMIANPYHRSLRTVQGGRAISLLPQFASDAPEVPVRLFYETLEPEAEKPRLRVDEDEPENGDFALRRDRDRNPANPVVLLEVRSLQPGPTSQVVARSSLKNLWGHGRQPVEVSWQIRQPPDPEKAEHGLAIGAFHMAVPSPVSVPEEQPVRLGSLDLTLPPPPATPQALAKISVFRGDVHPTFPGTPSELPYVDLDIELALAAVGPGGQDGLPDEQFVQSLPEKFKRERAVVIPVEGSSSNRRDLILEVQEKTVPGSNQTLSMRLMDRGQGTRSERRSVVVLDRQPFLAAKVEVPRLQGSAEIQEIANWSGGSPHGASWELSAIEDLREGFVLELPPQGVGEAMEKINGPQDIEQDKAADFRFTPPARFELLASFFRQRFAEAPWNLRRILGYPGQRAPGAGIRRLEFEMLYGLGCEVDDPFLRLAEIASRLGSIPGDVPKRLPWPATASQKQVHEEFRDQWAEIFTRYFSRLAILEPWDNRQPDELVLEEGLRYQLRPNARLRYPIRNETLPDPLKGKIPAFDDGLAGGVAWGFESANVYHATWRDPKSTSGKLARPYFSALGGWGFQKASFDNDKTTIYADAAMGRTFFLSLERIGRIGILWNLAKHVIIYERTVAPSKQFHDQQDPHAGRPVLRKVREFVEILQPARQYPEFGAPPATRGFVTGSEFKSRVINVDSAWGKDEGTIGWQVPLWRPDAAAEKPDVYPKPQILLQVAADPEGGSSTLLMEIDEPEKLVFFTDTRKETDSRTDLWPAIEGIDYLDRPTPRAPKVPGHDPADLDRPLPDAPAMEPGFERFTWAVLPAERGANLVVERTEEALSAVIRNVTMMRARARQAVIPDNLARLLDEVVSLSRPAETALERLLAQVPAAGPVTAEMVERLKREIARPEIVVLLQDLRTRLQAIKTNPDLQEFLKTGADVCQALKTEATGALTSLASQVNDLGDDLRRNLAAQLRALEGSRESLRVEARAIVARKIDEIRQIARGIEAGLDLISRQVTGLLQEIDRLRTRTNAEIDDVVRALDAAKGSARREADRLRSRLREARARIVAFLDEVDSRLANVSDPRLEGAAKKVREGLRTVRQRIEAVLDEAEGLLASGDPEQVLERIKTELENVKEEIGELFDSARKAVEEGQKALRKLSEGIVSEKIQKAIDTADQDAGDAIDEFFRSEQEISDLLAEQIDAAVKAALAGILAGINALKAEIETAIDEVCEKLISGLDTVLTQLLERLDNAAGPILDDLRNRLDDIAQLVQQGTAVGTEALRRAIETGLAEVRQNLAPLVNGLEQGVNGLIKDVVGTVAQVGDNVLRLLRAFGDTPRVPTLDFNRQRIAYFFDELAKAVDITPVTALLNRLGDDLKGLGIRLPTSQLLDRVLPDKLPDFDLSKILPDFAGLKLDNLFPGLKMPEIAKDNIKVTHGVDPQTRRAWAQADVDVPFDKPSDLFSTGPVTLRLLKSRFRAQARIEAGLDGPPRQTLRGNLTGDWQISVLSTPIVVFRDTALIFEDGRVRFDLSPNKVEFTAALRFLADLIKKVGYSEGGFSVRVIQENNLPVGIESVLDLPLPDLAAGAFSITSLRLGSTFELRATPGAGGLDFTLATRFHLGRKEAPFALAISILTGGGWLDASARYAPRTGAVTTRVSIGIVAGGSLAFAFGPVRGGVYIFFGIEAEFASSSAGGQSLNVAILLLVRGEVQVLGFLSVSLHLLLQAQYQQDGRLIGTGTLSISIKVSVFFTVRVSTSVRYEFAKGSGSRQESLEAVEESDPFTRAAEAYVGMLE